ncbi:MAG: hypothetical protein P4L51_03790 [Puia sp.]|nr:hypothetical protein [Puia sp.]
MKSPRQLVALSFLLLAVFYACRKNNTENHTAQPTPVIPDLTASISASVAGFVTDETGNPIAFAQVLAGDKQTMTDEYGYFGIAGALLAKTAGLVKVSKTGLFNGYKTFIPQAGKETFVRVKLLAKTEIGVVDAAAGGTASTTDGAQVALPANGVVLAIGSSPYTGPVHISARWIDPSDNSDNQLGMPGDSRGTDSAGYLKGLQSYSTLAVELTGNNGQLLQIAPGKTATLTTPIPSPLSARAPASLSLWSLNDSSGLWKQESTAVKTGNSYTGTVSHFSFWDDAIGAPLVNFTARILDAASQPLTNVPVSITLANMPQNAGYGRYGYTDANGIVTGEVFANANLVLNVLTTCSLPAYSHPFTTTAADIDLGTLTGDLGQNEVTIKGTVTNCSNQPVTSGFVQTYDNGFYNRIPISNGAFNFTGLACTNTSAQIVVVDNGSNQQNTPVTITFVPGLNDLGALTACGVSTMGSATYTIDGVSTTLIEPTDTIDAYFLTTANITATQILTASGHPNTDQQLSFQFDGGTDTGVAHHFSAVYSNGFPGGSASWPVPVPVHISSYGKIGDFVSGDINCNLIDANNTAIHTFVCTFRVRRFN